MALRLIAATAYDWFCTGLMGVLFALIATFWYKLMQGQRNPHAWRK